jgi:hypothetical protein
MLSAIPWITDSTTEQNKVFIAYYQDYNVDPDTYVLKPYRYTAERQSGNEPPSSSCATGRHIRMQS